MRSKEQSHPAHTRVCSMRGWEVCKLWHICILISQFDVWPTAQTDRVRTSFLKMERRQRKNEKGGKFYQFKDIHIVERVTFFYFGDKQYHNLKIKVSQLDPNPSFIDNWYICLNALRVIWSTFHARKTDSTLSSYINILL